MQVTSDDVMSDPFFRGNIEQREGAGVFRVKNIGIVAVMDFFEQRGYLSIKQKFQDKQLYVMMHKDATTSKS